VTILVLETSYFNGLDQIDVLVVARPVDASRYRPGLKQIFACRFEKLRSHGAVQPCPKILRLRLRNTGMRL
jgi:hypothetical protein